MFCPETPVNQIERRMQELASFQHGQKKKYIRAVRRKVVIPDRRYTWKLFEHPADTEPIDTVVLDVNHKQALQIDRSVAETFRHTLLSSVPGTGSPQPRSFSVGCAVALRTIADGCDCPAITSTARFGF